MHQQSSFASRKHSAIAHRTEQEKRHKDTLELAKKDEENDPYKDLCRGSSKHLAKCSLVHRLEEVKCRGGNHGLLIVGQR